MQDDPKNVRAGCRRRGQRQVPQHLLRAGEHAQAAMWGVGLPSHKVLRRHAGHLLRSEKRAQAATTGFAVTRICCHTEQWCHMVEAGAATVAVSRGVLTRPFGVAPWHGGLYLQGYSL